jgi:hypothetical protein
MSSESVNQAAKQQSMRVILLSIVESRVGCPDSVNQSESTAITAGTSIPDEISAPGGNKRNASSARWRVSSKTIKSSGRLRV